MRGNLHILAFAFLLSFLWGCQKESEDKVSVTLRDNTVTAAAQEVFVGVTATGSWTISLQFPSGGQWASVNPVSGSGSRSDIRLKFQENTEEDPRSLTITVTPANGQSASATVTQLGKDPDPVIGSYGYDVAPMGWLELPACVQGDGREVLAHDMKGNKYVNKAVSGTRNYSCYWDYDDHLSLWVAYPLNNSLKGSGSFDYSWGFDPIIPEALQPDITQHSYGGTAYGGGNWNRGHQLPRADRQTSPSAVSSTCYPTNMTPQDGKFNSGIWGKLETQVRNRASKADTLYVVTGCLFDGSSKYTSPYSDTRYAVKVPTHYFKALLYKGSSSEATGSDGYMMCGFFLPHDTAISGKEYSDYMVSIDVLEERTGIDFFPNLEKRNKSLSVQLEKVEPNRTFWLSTK